VLSAENEFVVKSELLIPPANAATESLEDSTGQSVWPPGPLSSLSNHSSPRIVGNSLGSADSIVEIHIAFEPPASVEPVSPTIIGLLGAIAPVISA
jgi:hypothetical protein